MQTGRGQAAMGHIALTRTPCSCDSASANPGPAELDCGLGATRDRNQLRIAFAIEARALVLILSLEIRFPLRHPRAGVDVHLDRETAHAPRQIRTPSRGAAVGVWHGIIAAVESGERTEWEWAGTKRRSTCWRPS